MIRGQNQFVTVLKRGVKIVFTLGLMSPFFNLEKNTDAT
jgi:hypothetical protein